MAKIKFHDLQAELLFILGSTKDARGRRVLVRCDNVENVIYPETLESEALHLIGIDSKGLELIQRFFNG